MTIRVSSRASYTRVLDSLLVNQLKMFRAQEQIASGRRILRPSDDPTGTARILSLERQLADVDRYRDASASGTSQLNSASSALQDASSLLSEARSLIIQGMSGTISPGARDGLALELELLRDQLVEIGNTQDGDRFLFGGTLTSGPPFVETTVDGESVVTYRGNDQEQMLEVAAGSYVGINVPGNSIFDRFEPNGTRLTGSTGLALGSSANGGRGYDEITLRHDSTDLGTAAGIGLALVSGGSEDTFLGVDQLVIDATNRTVRLGDGTEVRLPDAGSPDLADVRVTNGQGGELNLDFTGWTGVDFTGDVTGEGSVAIGNGAFEALDFTDGDFALRNGELGRTVHVDLTGVGVEGTELVTFSGAASIFQVIDGVVADLKNDSGMSDREVFNRLTERLSEFDRNSENVLVSVGVIGSRSNRLSFSDERAADLSIQLESLMSVTQDADFAEVALELARAETTLQTAQAAGARLIQNTLLNFLQ